MAWKNGYYYRNRREGKRVISEYIGGGPVASLVAELDAHERRQAEQEAARWREFVAEQTAVDQRLAELGMQLNELVDAALKASGYHSHHGEWRLKRMTEIKKRDGDELFTLTNKANPAPADLREFTRWLLQHPDQVDRWGDTANLVEFQLLRQIIPDSEGAKLATRFQLENMRDALGFATAPALERPLIRMIVLCWLRVQAAETAFTQTMKAGVSIREAEFRDTQLTAAQRRYLRAVETLARIRKLNINIQVNIADKQIVVNQPTSN